MKCSESKKLIGETGLLCWDSSLGVTWEPAGKAVQALTCQTKLDEECLIHWCVEPNYLTDSGK